MVESYVAVHRARCDCAMYRMGKEDARRASTCLHANSVLSKLLVPMDIRQRLLDAAARVYARHGFRGATTRLIASEAGVNEVTLFRTFGSKSGLFEQLLQCRATQPTIGGLPDRPRDPERELTAWAEAMLGQMRASASFLRKSIGELEERPDAALTACQGPTFAADALRSYVQRLRDRGLASANSDVDTAISMLLSAFFGDAMCRDIIPAAFPEPVGDAPRKYVCTFLRAVGARAGAGAKGSALRHRAVH